MTAGQPVETFALTDLSAESRALFAQECLDGECDHEDGCTPAPVEAPTPLSLAREASDVELAQAKLIRVRQARVTTDGERYLTAEERANMESEATTELITALEAEVARLQREGRDR
jgi:hypothetical protein